MKRSIASLAIVGTAVMALVLGACSGDDDDNDAASTTSATTAAAPTTAAVDRPDGPVADMSEELEGGNGVYMAASAPLTVPEGYEEHEYAAVGTATSYKADGELGADGVWKFASDATADYRTRVLVRRPENPDDFSGLVIVEWLNVSGGAENDPEFTMSKEEIVRAGHVWVGVSAQASGVEGGPIAVPVPDVPGSENAGKGLVNIDPARYSSLVHPGDGFSYDIFTQVARALREGQGLGDLQPQHIVAAGQSQSAFAMVTYVNGVQPMTQAFDGFFLHSRGAPGFGLSAPEDSADILSSLGGGPTILRSDTRVPIMDVQTESDVTGPFASSKVRQPDTDTFRLWEVPGTAHADVRLSGEENADVFANACGTPMNDGPMHVVGKAAWHHFAAWVAGGDPPPTAPLIELSDDLTTVQRDANEIALGGVRTPPVDVPTRLLSGAPGGNPSAICILIGSTTPLPAEKLAALYSSQADFQEKYDASVDDAIDAGYVLEADRDAIESFAHPELVSG